MLQPYSGMHSSDASTFSPQCSLALLQISGPSLRQRLLKYKETSHDRLAASSKRDDVNARPETQSVTSTTEQQHLSTAGPHETQDSHLGNPGASSRFVALLTELTLSKSGPLAAAVSTPPHGTANATLCCRLPGRKAWDRRFRHLKLPEQPLSAPEQPEGSGGPQTEAARDPLERTEALQTVLEGRSVIYPPLCTKVCQRCGDLDAFHTHGNWQVNHPSARSLLQSVSAVGVFVIFHISGD